MKEDDSSQQQINEQSLTHDLEKNRESLQRKLQTRRSLQQLVDIGIMPTPQISLLFYQQRKQLQMRKTQDILKNKILFRPNRQLLIEHNILSDTTAAPAIQQTQCQLKRARLVDDLNNKLSVRPGILELVANNIFEIDSDLKQAIQDGDIQYPSVSRPLRQKTSSFANTAIFKRSLSSIRKSKSCLTFHEYKGPLQKVEITKVPLQSTLKSFEHNNNSSKNHYRIQLRQQQLFLELVHNDKSIENEDNPIGNLLQQSMDNILLPTPNDIQSFETMKLADLKNECKKLNISSNGTKMKLIEKIKNARMKISDKTTVSSQTVNNESLPTTSSLPLSSLSDQELYHQSNHVLEQENQIENLKQNLQQTIVSLTPESVAQYLAQSQTSSNPLSSPYQSITPSCQSFTNQSTNTNVNFNLLDDYTDSSSILTLPSDDSYSHETISSPVTDMDWMTIPSPSIVDNNLDFTQFLNQFDNDHHHLLYDSTCQQQQNTLSFDLFSA